MYHFSRIRNVYRLIDITSAIFLQSLVEEQMVQEADLVRLRRPRYVADIPDALYMVDEKPRPIGMAGVDVLAAAFPGTLTVTS